jgi:flagellar basal-body rod protein FlgF
MQSGMYVGLSGQMALERRMETIAHNVANASTAGFRSEEVRFESVLSSVTPEPVTFVSTGKTYLSRQSGGFVQTNNQFDVAVQGDAWLSVDVNGTQVYTRDGRMRMTDNGDLQTLNGNSILDAGGAPITLDPNGGVPQIAHDGTITQKGRKFGAIGLYRISENAKLTRAENSGVIPSLTPEAALDFSNVGVVQGYVEQSNVNPVQEITQLISVQRAFEGITNSMNLADTALQEAIKTLGDNS